MPRVGEVGVQGSRFNVQGSQPDAREARDGVNLGGVDGEAAAETQGAVLEGHDPWGAALDFARRKRLGPFGPVLDDPKLKARQLGAFARAGHPQGLARRILAARSEDELEA